MTKLDKLLYEYSVNKLINVNNIIILADTHKLDFFVSQIIKKKTSESHHTIDSFNEAKRWRTGIGGELALEQLINEPFVDLTIGDSKDYHTPDLLKLGLSVGIKTVEYGKYPVIFKNSKKPEIIILKLSENSYSILGLATVEVLNTHQDDNQILSPALRARGTKTGFVGLHKLKQFNSIDELKKLL